MRTSNLPFLLKMLCGWLLCWGACAWVVAQTPDSLVLIPDTTGVDSSLVTPIALVDSSVQDSIRPEPDSIQLAWSTFRAMQAQLDSLRAANVVLATIARRRLTLETYTDSFRQYHFHTCVVDPQRVSIRLFNRIERSRRQVHTFASIQTKAREQHKELVFAMNGGMFERDRHAKGLLIIGGKTHQALDTATAGYGNFYMQPNGIFALDTAGKAYVLTTQDFMGITDSVKMVYATQSGPMMLNHGKINDKFNDGSPNRHIRNAVGVTPDNQVVFAISSRPVTFFELSSYLMQQGCTQALYLDGAISQAYFPALGVGRIEDGMGLGPIIAILQTQDD